MIALDPSSRKSKSTEQSSDNAGAVGVKAADWGYSLHHSSENTHDVMSTNHSVGPLRSQVGRHSGSPQNLQIHTFPHSDRVENHRDLQHR